jgi:hypothetical protein
VPVLETPPSFGNCTRFWKLPPVLETATGFGNSPHFPELPPVLGTGTGFGNSPRFPNLLRLASQLPLAVQSPNILSLLSKG